MELLQLLLDADAPDVRRTLPQARYEVKRLSAAAGCPVVFTLRALPYGRVQDIRRMQEEDQSVHILLAGCADPDLRAEALQRHYDAPTPVDAVKALLLPGEIEDLSAEVERLSGFRRRTIEEIKND